ncbi:hypothetical protein ES703_103985 [subsurface metagenome]
MALGKIDHIDVSVDDLEKAEEYFTKKLGFKLLRRTEHGGKSIELQSPAGDFLFDFHQESDEEVYKAWKEEAPGGPLFLSHIAFKVDNINKEFEELKSKGVSFNSNAPGFNPTTGRTLANVADADGRFWIQLTD